jgi:hypothetical protein
LRQINGQPFASGDPFARLYNDWKEDEEETLPSVGRKTRLGTFIVNPPARWLRIHE